MHDQMYRNIYKKKFLYSLTLAERAPNFSCTRYITLTSLIWSSSMQLVLDIWVTEQQKRFLLQISDILFCCRQRVTWETLPSVRFNDKMNSVAFLNSNCNTPSKREIIVAALSRQPGVRVSSLGQCLPGPAQLPKAHGMKLAAFRRYYNLVFFFFPLFFFCCLSFSSVFLKHLCHRVLLLTSTLSSSSLLFVQPCLIVVPPSFFNLHAS